MYAIINTDTNRVLSYGETARNAVVGYCKFTVTRIGDSFHIEDIKYVDRLSSKIPIRHTYSAKEFTAAEVVGEVQKYIVNKISEGVVPHITIMKRI